MWLIRVRAGEGSELEEESGREAHGNGGTAAQACANGDGGAQSIQASRELGRAEREKEV